MISLFAEQALLPDGWRSNVRLAVEAGVISSVQADAASLPGDERVAILIPGMPNLHSHAFQRGMAGHAETRGPGADSFWSWREVMYRLALTMTPEQMQAIAAQLYVEMLEAGFTRVGEFHYLHHDRDGAPYANLAEMADRIAAASAETGIALTLLPVFYAHSGFGGSAPTEGQRRFINDLNRFGRLIEKSREAVQTLNQAVVGIAPHSLRAATPDELTAILPLAGDGPVHIHIAEQLKEVDDCIAWSGRRPVEWLLANAPVDSRWCLIHATHMTEAETSGMAQSGAVAGLCPVTEANLGDGTFPAPLFLERGGAFGVGSDSNVLIGVADELRQLEYSQRLAHRARNVLAQPGQSNGRALFDAAVIGGAQALGTTNPHLSDTQTSSTFPHSGPSGHLSPLRRERKERIDAGASSPPSNGGEVPSEARRSGGRPPSTGIAPGLPADLVALDTNHPTLTGKSGDAILDAWVFANGTSVDAVWVGGKRLVEAGRHIHRDAIRANFRRAMLDLTGAWG